MLYAKNSYKNFLLDHSNYRFEAQKNCPVVYTVDNNDLADINADGEVNILDVVQLVNIILS